MGGGGEEEETASLKCEKRLEISRSQIPHRGLTSEAGNFAIPSVHLLD